MTETEKIILVHKKIQYLLSPDLLLKERNKKLLKIKNRIYGKSKKS